VAEAQTQEQGKSEAEGSGRTHGYLMLLAGDERATSDAALGIALRGAGHSLRVHIIQFQKAGRERGEVVATSFLNGVSLSQYGLVEAEQTTDDVDGPGIRPERIEAAMNDARQHVRRRVTNILILDGILSLIRQNAIPESDLIDLWHEAASWLDIVATGCIVSDGLHEAADSVTVMETVKAPPEEASMLRRGLHF
jgi:cob(I)alamin adenosyltransferase